MYEGLLKVVEGLINSGYRARGLHTPDLLIIKFKDVASWDLTPEGGLAEKIRLSFEEHIGPGELSHDFHPESGDLHSFFVPAYLEEVRKMENKPAIWKYKRALGVMDFECDAPSSRLN